MACTKHEADELTLVTKRISRRTVVRQSFLGIGWLMTGNTLYGCGLPENTGLRPPETDPDPEPISNIGNLGPLRSADVNGVRLPEGFTSRIVARSKQEVIDGDSFEWHGAPDGGATYAHADGGWVYVSNSEISGDGGVGALRFDATGNLIDAYPILRDSNRNCAGGKTPWGTWLSCEETNRGGVWECDPMTHTHTDAVFLPALGAFGHEAVAVDPIGMCLYMTEDNNEGRFYRYVPDSISDGKPDLHNGQLQVAKVTGGAPGPNDAPRSVTWINIGDPSGNPVQTRDQQPESTPFKGGEGIWYHDGKIYFATKGDNRVWIFDLQSEKISILYDKATSDSPILSGVDNLTVSSAGDVLVAEDGGNLEIVAITPEGKIVPVIQLVGHDDSEITGPAFDPSGQRLYFSSQRGTAGNSNSGITYEITGPFFVEATI